MNKTTDIESPVTLIGFGQKDLYARREKIFTRFVGGFYQRLRFFTGWPLLLGFFVVPWINFAQRQAVLFDLPARQFHILGLTLWPQDLWLLGWILMISAFALFAVTTAVGRLWCGYTCPQTVWTAIFMWIEQVTEGSRHQRIRLDNSPWSLSKLRKRLAKHSLWLGWAMLTGLTFVGYFTPIRELVFDIASFDISGWTLFWVVFFTLATYGNAGWLREQVCIYMCPYARFQSAMIDSNTLTVSYDPARGEPRGSRKRAPAEDLQALRSAPATQGDCIDCQLCVQVCPTGIDIRNGLQYECIGCAHCIDACNQVMAQMNYAPGLIRYTTERALAGDKAHPLNIRTLGYGAVTAALACVFIYAVYSRAPMAIDILRDRGTLFQVSEAGVIRNDYQLKIMNKTQHDSSYQLRVVEPASIKLASQNQASVAPGQVDDIPLQLISSATLTPTTQVVLELCDLATHTCVSEETSFFAPQATGAPR